MGDIWHGMRVLGLAGLLLATLAACGDEAADSADERVPAPGPSDLLVRYERTGGVDNVRELLIVRPDGAAALTASGSRARFRLPQWQLDELRRALAEAGFPSLDPTYGDGGGGVVITDVVTLVVQHAGYTVRIVHESRAPEELRPALGILSDIVAQNRPEVAPSRR